MCEICGRMIDHDPRCPNYIPRKASHYCSSCGNGIYDGEEYIENLDGEYRHYECFHGMRDLLEWLGFEIKMMELIDYSID
mgnify:FL=1